MFCGEEAKAWRVRWRARRSRISEAGEDLGGGDMFLGWVEEASPVGRRDSSVAALSIPAAQDFDLHHCSVLALEQKLYKSLIIRQQQHQQHQRQFHVTPALPLPQSFVQARVEKAQSNSETPATFMTVIC